MADDEETLEGVLKAGKAWIGGNVLFVERLRWRWRCSCFGSVEAFRVGERHKEGGFEETLYYGKNLLRYA